MFRKLVAIEPVSLIPSAEKALHSYAEKVVMFPDVPAGDDEIVARIGDADAVLLSYTSQINRSVLEKCPNIKYIGMCCSLYSPESANVDIRYANERGITVTGIRDYGDEGVVEYVVSELVRCLHGFGQESWEEMPREITGLKVGVIGLGKSGGMIADALKFFGRISLILPVVKKRMQLPKDIVSYPWENFFLRVKSFSVVSIRIQSCCMRLSSNNLEIKRYCSIPGCLRRGTTPHSLSG